MNHFDRIRELEAENRQLRSKVTEFGGELDHIGSRFVASSTRKHFHRPECQWVAYIPPVRIREFDSHREAVRAGYKPCKTCRA